MKTLFKVGAVLTLAAGTLGFAAHAADAESTWAAGENNGKTFLYAADASGPSLTLNCSDTMGIQAGVYLNGNGMDDLTLSSNSRLGTRNIELDSDTTDPKDGDWAYIRSAKTLISTKSWQGKRIFNAAVTGSPVTLDIARVGSYTITPPAVNDEFKTFVSDCDAI